MHKFVVRLLASGTVPGMLRRPQRLRSDSSTHSQALQFSEAVGISIYSNVKQTFFHTSHLTST